MSSSSIVIVSEPSIHPGAMSPAIFDAICAECPVEKVAERLLAGDNPNAACEDGFTALHEAVRLEKTEVLGLLLGNGANPLLKDSDGLTPLMHAVLKSYYAAIPILTENPSTVRGAYPTCDPLYIAVCRDDTAMVDSLFQAGLDPWETIGHTSLITMAQSNGMIQHLLAMGLPVDGCNPYGETLLMEAVVNEDADRVSLLLNAGANPHLQDLDGDTPAILAVCEPSFSTMQTFSEHNVDLSWTDVNGAGLIWYLLLGHQESEDMLPMLTWLIMEGADVHDVPDYLGEINTLMVYAGGEGADPGVIQVLIEAGVEVDTQTQDGFTALMVAAGSGALEAVEALIEAGADESIKADNGWTALDYAIDEGHQEIVQCLQSL